MGRISLLLGVLFLLWDIPDAQGTSQEADINHDGVVDTQDLFLFYDQWHTGATFTPTPAETSTPISTTTATPTRTPTRTPIPTATNHYPEIIIDLPNLLPNAKPLIMVRIPAGSFQMGSNIPQYNVYTEPVHSVTIEYDFYISKYEVTEAQWEAVAHINPASDSSLGPDYPAPVSWYECQDFISQLNSLDQGSFRLPSESEWEYACRAGSTTLYYFGDLQCSPPTHGGITCNLDSCAWWDNSTKKYPPYGRRKIVGLLEPNAYGLYDMHGNMFEWCQDWFHYDYNGAPNDGSAWESPVETYRSVRSGAAHSYDWECTSASRKGHPPDTTLYNSLRLVRDP